MPPGSDEWRLAGTTSWSANAELYVRSLVARRKMDVFHGEFPWSESYLEAEVSRRRAATTNVWSYRGGRGCDVTRRAIPCHSRSTAELVAVGSRRERNAADFARGKR